MEKEQKPIDKPAALLTAALQEEYNTMARCQEYKKQADEEYAASSARAIELETAIEALINHKSIAEVAEIYHLKIIGAADALVQMMNIIEAHKEGRHGPLATIEQLEMLASKIAMKGKEAENAGSGN